MFFFVFPGVLCVALVQKGYFGAGVGPAASKDVYPFMITHLLPVGLKGTGAAGSAVRFMLKFKAALYISPAASSSDVRVSGIDPLPEGKLRLTLVNAGTAHVLMRKPVLKVVHTDGTTSSVGNEALKIIDGENIHAGATRHFDLAAPLQNIASAALDFEPAF